MMFIKRLLVNDKTPRVCVGLFDPFEGTTHTHTKKTSEGYMNAPVCVTSQVGILSSQVKGQLKSVTLNKGLVY